MARARRRTDDELTKGEALRLWRQARPVALERRNAGGSVLGARLPAPVLEELVAEAQRQGKGPAALARELVEEAVARKRHGSR